MSGMDASKRKKGIRMVGVGIGLMVAPVLALAQTIATTTSQAPAYSQTVPPAAYYYGPDMMGGWGPGYYGPAMMGGFWLFWGLFCLLLIIGIVVGIVLLVRAAFPGRKRRGSEKAAALDVLHERYARGEIGRDEYLDSRRDLEQ